MEENSNVYMKKSENEEMQQPVVAEQSSVYGQQKTAPSFAEIVQQGPANYQSPNAAPQPPFGQQPNYGQPQQEGTAPQPPFGQQPNYGQPQQGGTAPQPPFGQQPNYGQPNQGLQFERPKKGKGGLVIAIIAVLVVLAGGIGAFMLIKGNSSNTKDPVKLLEQGLAIQEKENEAYTASLDETLGAVEILERQEKEPHHLNVDLSFTIPASYDLDNISVELDSLMDKSKKLNEYEVSVGTYGFKMSVADIIMSDSMLYFSSPLFLDDVYHIDIDNFEEDFMNSPWAEAADPDLFKGFETNVDNTSGAEELMELVNKYAALFEENREIALLSEPKEFTLHGKTEKCNGVSITISKDVMNEWIESFKTDFMDSNYYKSLIASVAGQQALDGTDFEEYQQEADELMEELFSIRFEQDFVMHVYMDSKGRIINQSTPEDIPVSDSEIKKFSIDFNYLGEERAMDVIDGFFYIETSDAAYYLGLDRNAEVSEETYKEKWTVSFGEVDGVELSFSYKNDWSYSDKEFDMEIALFLKDEYGYTTDINVTATGAFTGIVKGDTYTLEIDNATIDYDGDTLVIMSGKIVSEFADDVIEVPESSINFFDLTEDEIGDILFGSSSSMYY